MEQKFIVHNKKHLLIAFKSVVDIPPLVTTQIILKRKAGETTFNLLPVHSDNRSQMRQYKAALANIRRTPAECFK